MWSYCSTQESEDTVQNTGVLEEFSLVYVVFLKVTKMIMEMKSFHLESRLKWDSGRIREIVTLTA